MTNNISSLNVRNLFTTGLTAAQTKAIDEATKDGVLTKDELATLKKAGLDTNVIAEKFDIKDAEDIGETKAGDGKYSNMSKDAIVTELKKSYGGKAISGDSYGNGNKNLADLQKAMDAGLIADLFASGLSKSEVADIIGQVFDGSGIKANGNGGYTCPYGHGDEAKKIYDEFTKLMAQASGGIESVKNDPELKEMQANLDANNLQIMSNNFAIEANTARIDKIKAEMEQLKEEVTRDIENAIKESEEIQEEQKANAASIVSSNIAAFTAANGDMTYDQFRAALKSDLDDSAGEADSKLSSVIGNMLDAESRLGKLDGMLRNIQGLMTENDDLVNQNNLLTKNNEKLSTDIATRTEQLIKEAEDCADEDCNRCDPIGFEANGKKYDFFVDADNDGNLSNAKEFLGAEDGWAAMANLDTDGDGKITKAELQGAENLKMVVTNEDGTQEVQNIADVFANANLEDAVISLDSYNEVNKDVNKDVTLLGTYQIDLDGIGKGDDAIEGYNTLDSMAWLNENYKFSDTDVTMNGSQKGTEAVKTGYTTESFGDQFEELEASINGLHTKWESAWQTIGIDASESMKDLRNKEESIADATARRYDDKFQEVKAKEEAQQAEEANAANQEPVTQTEEEFELDENGKPIKKK